MIEPLRQKHPAVDTRYVFAVLRAYVHHVLGAQPRETLVAWKRFLVALDDLERACWADKTEEESDRSAFGLLRAQVEIIRGHFGLPHLPDPREPDAGGRPSVWGVNVYTWMLKDHFEEATGSPRWRALAGLFAAAPQLDNLLMDKEHIRQRLVLEARADAAPVQERPSIPFLAAGLKARYREEGAGAIRL